jgi:hypothetical protein
MIDPNNRRSSHPKAHTMRIQRLFHTPEPSVRILGYVMARETVRP